MADRERTPMATEAVILVAGLVATVVARKVIQVVWVAATGRSTPDDPTDPAVSTRDAVVFAVASGAALGLARLVVQRQVNQARVRREAKAVAA
jgi:hypothetical protein